MEPNQVEPAEAGTDARGNLASALLVPMLRSRWLVVACVLLGLLGGVFLGIIKPNSFLSSGKLLVRPSSREEATPEMVIQGPGNTGAQVRDQVNNELQLLSVPQVFERVARDVTPPRIFAAYDPTAKDGPDTTLLTRLFHRYQKMWFTREGGGKEEKIGHALDSCPLCIHETVYVLMQDLRLGVEPGSSVITILYASHDPELARTVVASFMDASEEHHRQTFSTNTTLEFVAERLQESLAAEQKATQEFTEYRISCGVSDYDVQRAGFLESRSEVEREYATEVSALEQARSRLKEAQQLIAGVAETVQDSVERNAIPNPEWTVLRTRLLTLQDTLERLDLQVGGTVAAREAERQIIQRQIQRTTADLAEEPEFREQDAVLQFVANPHHQRLTTDIDNLKTEIVGREVIVSQKAERLKSIEARLKQTEECGPRYKYLESQAAKAKTSYDDFSRAYERANLMNLLDQLQFSSLRRIQEATLPLEKEGPKRLKFILVGLILGIAAGGTLGFLRMHLDPYVRSPAEAEDLLGVRVLTAVPPSGLSRRLRKMIEQAGR